MKQIFKPHRRNGRFYTHALHTTESLLFQTLPSLIYSIYAQKKPLPSFVRSWVSQEAVQDRVETPTVTWVGHATCLIQLNGINILTDPIFSDPSFFHPRILPLGIPFEKLPPIDLVVISHNHHDHMDAGTIMRLAKRFPEIQFFVPRGDEDWFMRRGLKVKSFMWEESHLFNNGVTCTFVPGYHWSGRGFFDTNRSLWGGWMIYTNNICIYFAGDTAYYKPCFKRIAHLFAPIDVALLPVGPVEPREAMRNTHVDAYEAGKIFRDLKARHFIPIHWGTFGFGVDRFELPIDMLKEWWKRNADRMRSQRLHLLKAGQRWQVPVGI